MMQHYSALLTDYYELAMAQDYWRQGKAEENAIFHLFLRRNPFQGNFTLAAGLGPLLDYLANWKFTESDCAYLASLKFKDNSPRFDCDFLEYLQNMQLKVDVWSVPEGTPVFAGEPLLRVEGPLLQCQILETALMNIINISSLIATKAARVRMASPAGTDISEFGLRRAQGPNGGVLASRAAYIGGIDSTSNTLAGKEYNLPVLGTIAHSWILSFSDEMAAFRAAIKAMGHNTILLIDTFDTINGAKLAIQAVKEAGDAATLQAVRLDSGDLCLLSQQVREILDAAGLQDCKIIASGDLDEYRIAELVEAGAKIDIWGVGTRLATAFDQPALDLAYKLSAIELDGVWQMRAKQSDTPGKASLPGKLQVARQKTATGYVDTIFCEQNDSAEGEMLLQAVVVTGKAIVQLPEIIETHKSVLDLLPELQNITANVTVGAATRAL